MEGLAPGVRLYRNLSMEFERQVEASLPSRHIPVSLDVKLGGAIEVRATSQDGRQVTVLYDAPGDLARDAGRMLQTLRQQLSKHGSVYSFSTGEVSGERIPFMTASFLNGIRRDIAEKLDAIPVNAIPLRKTAPDTSVAAPEELTYKANIANSQDRALYSSRGAKTMEQAYELSHRPGVELMRSRYCVRHQLGMCPKKVPGMKPEPLYLVNNGRRLRLQFHCDKCEMTVEDYLPL